MNKAFLYEMLRTESVSGGEIPLQKKVAAYMREQGAEVETDLAGDVISSINSASPSGCSCADISTRSASG